MATILHPEGSSITRVFLSCSSRKSRNSAIRLPGFPTSKTKFKIFCASVDSAMIEDLGLGGIDLRNPSLSFSHRPTWIPPPNQIVLEAQAKVCTGPTQTRPLSEEQAFRVLDTILRSGGIYLKFKRESSLCPSLSRLKICSLAEFFVQVEFT